MNVRFFQTAGNLYESLLLGKGKATPVGMAFLGNPHECRLG